MLLPYYFLPLGVVIYTLFGGIKATFLTDYAHTVVLIVIIFIFAFTTWATSSKLGSPQAVWEIVTKLAESNPREGNAGGSYFTMHSRSGGMFFVINIIGNFGTVFWIMVTSTRHLLPIHCLLIRDTFWKSCMVCYSCLVFINYGICCLGIRTH